MSAASATTLKDAFAIAKRSDNLDEACRAIQDVLGIEDGGVAGLFFSRASEGATWRDMPIEDRSRMLIDYIVMELPMLEVDTPQKISVPGFFEETTGGGCMALVRDLPDDSRWMITTLDGSEIPEVGDEIGVGAYDEDGETIFEQTYTAEAFRPEEVLSELAARAPGGNQPQSFAEFQATRREMRGRAFGEMVGDRTWEDDPDQKLLVYQDRFHIEVLDDGRFQLILGNLVYITGEEKTLRDLELELYAYSITA